MKNLDNKKLDSELKKFLLENNNLNLVEKIIKEIRYEKEKEFWEDVIVSISKKLNISKDEFYLYNFENIRGHCETSDRGIYLKKAIGLENKNLIFGMKAHKFTNFFLGIKTENDIWITDYECNNNDNLKEKMEKICSEEQDSYRFEKVFAWGFGEEDFYVLTDENLKEVRDNFKKEIVSIFIARYVDIMKLFFKKEIIVENDNEYSLANEIIKKLDFTKYTEEERKEIREKVIKSSMKAMRYIEQFENNEK